MSPENIDGVEATIHLLGEHNMRPAIAAAAVGYKLGVTEHNIVAGIASLHSLPGRMNVLEGADKTWLIDDSYSSTPATALSALQTLYSLNVPQRIAVFGIMIGL